MPQKSSKIFICLFWLFLGETRPHRICDACHEPNRKDADGAAISDKPRECPADGDDAGHDGGHEVGVHVVFELLGEFK